MSQARSPISSLPALKPRPLAAIVSALLLGGVLSGEAQAQTFPATINLGSLSGTDGFRLDGVATGDLSGRSVSAAGDINGDGLGDLIIGAYAADPNGNSLAGSSYVVFGKTTPFTASLQLANLTGCDGFRIDGAAATDQAGYSVAAAGDINGDGIDDLIVGAFLADPNGNADAGSSYVVFGKSTGFAATLALSALSGSDGFRLDGVAAGDYSGRSVAAAGDINGDGLGDLIVGAVLADPNGNSAAGSSYVVFGKTSGFAATIDLGSLSGADGFRLDGVAAGDASGFSVAAAGDINGDGLGDLIVGADLADPNGNSYAGSSYVVFGKTTSFAATIDLGSLTGSDGFRLDGAVAGDYAGVSVAAAGDVNGDGLGDLIVGASFAGPNGNSNAGSGFVVFGKTTGFAAAINLGSLSGADGFRLDGAAANDQAGRSVAAAGDINDDGLGDLIVGAFGADPNLAGLAGSSYVVFGKTTAFSASLQLASLNGTDGFRLDGAAAVDLSGISVAAAGDINGDGIDDLIVGAFTADPNGNGNAGSSYVLFGRAAGAPVLSLNPLSLAFGNVPVSQTSAAQTVTLSNTGTANLTLGTLALSGAQALEFALSADTCSAQVIVPAASCSFDVSLSPAASGARAAQVDIPSDAPSSPDTLPVSGTGVQAAIALTPDPLAFGNVLVGSTSAVQSLTVANPGSAPLNVSAISAAVAPFTLSGGTCGGTPFTVAAAGSCTLDYSFSPTATGAANQTISVGSDAAPGSDNQFSLQGTGVQPILSLDTAVLNFGTLPVGGSASATVAVSNNGSGDLTITGISAPAAPFTIIGGSCTGVPVTLIPAASCTIDVGFAPGGAVGVFNGSFAIQSNAASSPDTVSLSGAVAAVALPVPGLTGWGLGLLSVLLGWFGWRRGGGRM